MNYRLINKWDYDLLKEVSAPGFRMKDLNPRKMFRLVRALARGVLLLHDIETTKRRMRDMHGDPFH